MHVNRSSVSLIIFISIFIGCSTFENKIEQKHSSEIHATDTLTAESNRVNIELLYRFKDNEFAKEVQGLFSEYFSLIMNNKAANKLFDTESLNFMSYPEVSQNLSFFYNKGFFKIHKPMIIAIYTQDNDTIVKLNYTRVDSAGIATSLATNNFGVTRSNGRLMLQNMVYLNSRSLEIKQVGNITYYFQKTHNFSMDSAREMQDFNIRCSKLFDVEPIYFRYFVSKSNIELNHLLGFDFKYD